LPGYQTRRFFCFFVPIHQIEREYLIVNKGASTKSNMLPSEVPRTIDMNPAATSTAMVIQLKVNHFSYYCVKITVPRNKNSLQARTVVEIQRCQTAKRIAELIFHSRRTVRSMR
jgi:hypothetical protein